MPIDESKLDAIRSTLAADGYLLEVRETGDRVRVSISATPETCADCLVPKPLMLGMLRPALGVAEAAIDLHYPDEA